MAMKAVGTEQPEVVAACVVCLCSPRVVEELAGFDHVALRQAIEVELVVDVEHRRGAACVDEREFDYTCSRVGVRAHVELVGQRARWTYAVSLHREAAIGRGCDLRQRLLCRAHENVLAWWKRVSGRPSWTKATGRA